MLVSVTLAAGYVFVENLRKLTICKNGEKLAQIQELVNNTIFMLEEMAQDEKIRSEELSYEEKAQILTDWNEGRCYMMIRILDQDMNVYKEGVGLASSLASRDYIRQLYSTGEKQVKSWQSSWQNCRKGMRSGL